MRLRALLAASVLATSCLAGAATTYTMTFSQGTSPQKVTVPLEGFILIQVQTTPDGPGEKKPVTIEFKPDESLGLFKLDGTLPKLVVNKTQAFSGQPTVISHLTFTNLRFIEVTTRQSGPDRLQHVRFTYDSMTEEFEK